MRIGINGSASLLSGALDTVLADIESAAADGFPSYWLAQTSAVDALAAFAVAGGRGIAADIELGTAVVPTFPQHPTAMAARAWTAQAAHGNVVLGIGLSHEPTVTERLGMAWDRPLLHMREYLEIVTGLFATGKADVDGEIWTAHVEMGLGSPPPSVMVAALGPQMLRLAGRVADGTILWMVGSKTVRDHIAPTIRAAAEEAGRPGPRVVCSLPICVTDQPDAVREFAAVVFANYGELPSYRAMLDREGAAGPADVCIIGDDAHVGAALDQLAEGGVTDFAALELPTNDEERARTREFLKGR